MKATQEILNLFNSYDSSYMMSDDSRAYAKGESQEIEIHAALQTASNDTLIEVRNAIDLSSQFISVPFGKYFEGLIEVVETVEQAPSPKEKQSKLSKIMSAAWKMFKAELFPSFAKALKASWLKFKLVSKLTTGIARFSYIKSNGETRQAIGTLRNGNFQYENKTNGSKRPGASHVVKYFDIVADAWRSCRMDRLIEIQS